MDIVVAFVAALVAVIILARVMPPESFVRLRGLGLELEARRSARRSRRSRRR